MVESQPSKLLVAGSIPVSRSRNLEARRTREFAISQKREIDRAAHSGPSATKTCRLRMTE